MENNTVGEWLRGAAAQIAGVSETPNLDAQLLALHVLGGTRSQLIAHPERRLTDGELAGIDELLQRLVSGAALPYLLGEWDFYGRRFSVTPDVLIPRPETEALVETVVEWLRRHPGCRRVADVGAGSGCVGLSILLESPGNHLVATDISYAALQVAKQNAKRFGLQNDVEWVLSDLLTAVCGRFDVIVANLPYIPSARLPGLEVTRREPRLALDGGADGLRLIERLLQQSAARLSVGGLLVLEIDDSHRSAAQLANRYLSGAVRIDNDLQGKTRMLVFERGK